MPRSVREAPIAKLSRPRIHRGVARERLFQRLDDDSRGRVRWIVAPPGAGKTTLLATYLDSRKLGGIWYQLDADDADPTSFFYHLNIAERARRGAHLKPALPALTPEYLGDLEGFSRRYFREFFGRLRSGEVLVLDNFQDLPAASQVPALIGIGLSELRDGVGTLIASRSDPPESMARLTASRDIAVVDWEELKLTPAETQAMTHAQVRADDAATDLLHEKCGGWAAGLVLLIERLRRGEPVESLDQPGALQEVFAYFAEQFFVRNSDSDQRVLLQLAFMPQFTAEAALQLTGVESSARLLDNLYRRHLFIDRRQGSPPVYQFHALLRAFLRHRAEQSMSASDRRGVAQLAARILEASAQLEEAMRLYQASGDEQLARSLVLREAPRLLSQGRWQLLVDWIEALPVNVSARDQWMLYWLGAARIAVNPPQARVSLERAYDLAVQEGDTVCEVLSATGMVHAHMLEYVAYRPLDRWIGVLEKLQSQEIVFPSIEAELNAQSALLAALAYRRPSHPAIEGCVGRLFELVHTGADASARLSGALYLTLYGGVSGPSAVSERAAPILRALAQAPGVSAMSRAFAWFVLSFYYLMSHAVDECSYAIERVAKIGEEEGLSTVQRFSSIIGAWQALALHDFELVDEWIRKLENVIVPTNLYDVASVHWLKGQSAIQRRDATTALSEAQKAVAIFDEAGTHFHRFTARNILVWAHVYRREFAEARHCIEQAREIAGLPSHGYAGKTFHAAEAFMALEAGDEDSAADSLKAVFGPATQEYDPFMFSLWRAWVPELAGAALRRGIEVDAVRKLVCLLDCEAPSPFLETWPWKARLHVLGRFELQVNDAPVVFGPKAPRKPLALLKALVCQGGSARDYQLIDALWPGEEADVARNAFGVALFRLRGLLGGHNAIEVKSGLVQLNPHWLWIDALAFDAACGSSEHGDASVEAALQLYRGSLLPEDAEEHWSLTARDRLRAKFIHHLGVMGRALEQQGDWDKVMGLYLRGIDTEPLAEALYQGLMRCHLARGQFAEGLVVHRRLSQMLAISLGLKPSTESQDLHRRLLSGS